MKIPILNIDGTKGSTLEVSDKLINLNKIVPIITPNKEYGAIDHKILYSKCFLFKNKAITSHTINIGINMAIAVKGP